jgi:glycosidase
MKKRIGFGGILLLFLTVLLGCSTTEGSTPYVTDPVPTPNPAPTGFQVPATTDIVMYEINPGAFSTTHDLQGIVDRLDAIKALGVNTIWIIPIFPVGQVNSFGSVYCVKDYKGVRSSLGNLENLKTLVSKAHEKGIAVLLDWVANHTSWDNAWITDHPDWYTHNAGGAIISPAGTNWNDVADLNFDNANLRLAMIDAMSYWVTTADIDGFRCDAANYVPTTFWEQAITALNAIPNKHLILLAEGDDPGQLTAGFQMSFSWNYLNALKNVFGTSQANPTSLYTASVNEYAAIPLGKRKLRFTTNHDESNIASPLTVYGNINGALAASVVAIYMDGVPMLYSGQEVGVTVNYSFNASSSINWNANSSILQAYQQLLGFYNHSNAARKGILFDYSSTSVIAFEKHDAASKVLVLVNPRNSEKTYTVPAAIQGEWTNALTNSPVTLGSTQVLSAYNYLVLKK